MTSVIKANEKTSLGEIRRLDQLAIEPSSSNFVSPITQKEQELLALVTQVKTLKENIKSFDVKKTKDLEHAARQGEEQARETFEKDEEQALSILANGIEVGLVRLDDKLSTVEALALLLSRTALENVFEPASDYGDHVGRMIKNQISAIRQSTILRIKVSASDYPTSKALKALKDKISGGKIEITTDPALSAGSCIFDLQLGHLELNIADHWDNLKTFLKQAALDEVQT